MLNALLAALALPLWVGCGYLLVLTLASARLRPPAAGGGSLRFAIVIPAHDEASGIVRTVASLRALRWPEPLRRIVVVADNCSDDTAALARGAGAEVIERFDTTLRGKGYALGLAFDTLLAERWADAMVVVDADTDASPHLLEGFAARLQHGAPAVQAFYGVRNPLASWRTKLMTLALGIFHRLRGRGRERLRLSSGLRGNGMCFAAETLRRVPYAAYSKVEDLEYGVQLGRAGIRVWYADEVEVRGDMVASERASRSQRERWEGGRAQYARAHGPALLREALLRGDRVLLDLALDLLVPPLATLGAAAMAVAMAAGALLALGWVSGGVALAAILPLLLLLAYVLRGVSLSGLGAQGWSALAAAPLFLAWKIAMRLRRRGPPKEDWVRTQRETGPDPAGREKL